MELTGIPNRMAAKEVIYAAGLLHDIGKWKEYDAGVDHASFGAQLAREVLSDVAFSPDEINIIARAIFEHRNISNDMSFLGERLYRADNLSRICFQCPELSNCYKIKTKETGSDRLIY
jgi:putative nucleotidyltransferase with HDIG domain